MRDLYLAIWLTVILFLTIYGIVSFVQWIMSPVDNSYSIQEIKQCTDANLLTYQDGNGHWRCKPNN